MKVVAYTAIYPATYDPPKEQPDLGCPLVLYTDHEVEAPGWEVRIDPLPDVDGDRMKAKHWKCRPDLAAPDAGVTIWLDGSLVVTRPSLAHSMLAALGDMDALYVAHPWRSCIYAEQEAGNAAPKYADQPTLGQVEHYRAQGHPEDWGLAATGMIVRRNNRSNAEIGGAWFTEQQRWSDQDQLSLPFLLHRRPDHRCAWIIDPWEHWWTVSPHTG